MISLTPYPHQIEFIWCMDNGYRRAFLLNHRKSGKDVICFYRAVKAACLKVGLYGYFFPFHDQARETVWEGTFSDGLTRFMDIVPLGMIDKLDQTQLKIYLTNGSIINIAGSDNIASLRGPNWIDVTFSEFGYHYPDVWEVVKPAIIRNKGIAVFNSTATDSDHMIRLMDIAKSRPDKWYFQDATIRDTVDHHGKPLIDEKDLEEDRVDGHDEAWIQQEYFNRCTGTSEASYWGDLLQKVEKEGRITKVPYNPSLPMEISFDLGRNMETALWFRQPTRTTWNYVDYYENRDQDFTYYFEVIRSKGYRNIHFVFPHDIKVTDFTSLNQSRLQIAIGHGATQNTVLENKGAGYLQMGIEAVRRMLPVCYFDAEKCKAGLNHLKNYKKQYDSKRRTYRNTPALSFHNNGADSFRYSAVYAEFPQARTDRAAASDDGLKDLMILNGMR